MTSRFSHRRRHVSNAIHAVIVTADTLRRFWLIALICLVMFTGAAVWLESAVSARTWAWKSWERLFGPPSLHSAQPHVFAQLGGSGVYTITTIDEPNAGASTAEGTVVFGINASGGMTGAYADQAGVAHGFVDVNGTFTSFDAFNETGLSPKFGWFQGTSGISIDSAGDVAGAFIDSNNAYHGFVRSAAGTITTFDDPNAPTANSSRGTFPLSINNGRVVGTYSTGNYDTTSLYHGFIYTVATGTFTDLEEPNAGNGETAYGREGTTPLSINDSGTVTGRYADSSGNRHGFIAIPPYSSPADYTSFDVSGAATNPGKGGDFSGTVPMSIDAAGDVVGSYTDTSFVRHGFIRSAGGTITKFDVPGATGQSGTIGGTLPTSIDPTGNSIAGVYTDSTGLGHGFVYYLPLTGKGSFTSFTPPGMTTSTTLPIQGFTLGVNASGTVVGFYLDSNEVAHGFEYTSTPTPTPTFNPPQGTYSSAQSVTISDTDSSAAIYYTTDGSTPTVNAAKYTAPISVSSTETINAIALDTTVGGYIRSAVASANYTISGTTGVTATPTFSPESGTYSSAQTVSILDTTPDATIYYAINGSPPTSSTVYSSPITVSSSETLEAMAAASGYSQSAVATATYTINLPVAATPTFSPGSGTYSSAQTVSISDTTPNATIYYAINGNPTTSSTVYSSPISVNSSETVEAIATASGYTRSSVATAVYTITQLTSGELEWTWMGGSGQVSQPGIYGNPGVPSAGNIPGGRQIAAAWTGASGNLWLFGGAGYDANGNLGQLNDLWKLNPSTNQWTWMGGSNAVPTSCTAGAGECGQPGVYGTLGTPAAGNIPGGRGAASSWTDSSGNLWLFGGSGYDANGNLYVLNDLWRFNSLTNQWAWMGGSNTVGQPGVYGTLGTPATGNVPASRYGASSWTDSSGNFWLFGGMGIGASGTLGWLNDVWEFNPSTNQWTWMGGSSTTYQSGHYGTLGMPAAGNIPGSRKFTTNWTDSGGNFWLFAGYGDDAIGAEGWLNDLWSFNPSTNQWTWMGGNSTVGSNGGQPGVYGTLGTPASGNVPGGRQLGASWIDGSGNFWLFGGEGLDGGGNYGKLNDLWEFKPSINQWTWIGGSSAVGSNGGQSGVYGTLGTPASSNDPGGRGYAANWTDSSGNFWLFGGNGFDANGNPGDLNDLWEYQPSGTTAPPAAQPNFSPRGGAYAAVQTVTISDQTPGATIYYTTDGITPTTNSTVYTGPITVSTPVTVEAIATASGYSPSVVAGIIYLSAPPQAGESTTSYTYKGNNYGTVSGLSCGGTYCTGGPYALTATFATTLTGSALNNLPLTDITGTLAGFSLTDGSGLVDDNSNGVYPSFQIATDPSGHIVSWLIETCGSTCNVQMQTNWHTYYSFQPGADFSETTANFAGDFGFVSDNPGTWTQAVGPPIQVVSTPTFSPAAGTYASAQSVTIADATTGATIYYTTSGAAPTTSSTLYSGPINVTATETIDAIAVASGYTNSAVASATYTIGVPTAATPTFSPAAGTYASAQTVTISDATPGATIYYTTNGTTPTTSSTVYSGPIIVSSSETLEAIATATGYAASEVPSAAYIINIAGFGAPGGSQPGSISIEPGATTGNTATISVVGANGFSGLVNLTCSITPIAANDPPACSLLPTSVTLSGTTVQTSTLTVSTTAPTSADGRPAWRQVGGIAFALVLLLAVPRRRRSWLPMLVLLAIVGSAGILGCGGGSSQSSGSSGTSPGAYTVTVTGTSGSISATITTVTLTIQ